MTVLDLKFLPLAKTLITKYGKAVTFVATTAGTYDTSTGEAAVTTATATVKGVFRGPTETQLDSGVAQSGDGYITFAALGMSAVPTPTDQVVIDGQTWRVLSVENLYSGESVCLYTAHVRS